MALSSFLSATPQFVGSRYNPEQDKMTMDTQPVILNPLTNISLPTTSPNPEYILRKSNEKLCRIFNEIYVKLQTNIGNQAVGIRENRLHTDESSEDNAFPMSKVKSGEYWDDSNLYLFIALGSVLKGMGHSPLHPLGMSFIDDYATPRNSAVYIGRWKHILQRLYTSNLVVKVIKGSLSID